MLWNNPCEKWNEFLARCEDQSRITAGRTKEAVADDVAATYLSHGGFEKLQHNVTPMSANESNRLKAVEAAVSRAKEKDLFNMLPYILASMSPETKLAFAAQYLQPAGLTIHLSSDEDDSGHTLESAVNTQMAANQACNSLLNAALDPTPQNIDAAEREAAKVIERFKRTRACLTAIRNTCKKVGSAMKSRVAQ